MDQVGEQPRFEIKPTIEQRPFQSPAVQAFFTKWCEINDSIRPQIVTRTDWDQKDSTGILEKRPDGKQMLYIPEDLQLWEMVGVMEAVDKDTFAVKVPRQAEKKTELMALGKTFQNAGVYIAQRLDFITQGEAIARALAEEFYGYGQSLISGKKPEESVSIDDISQESLTASEVETIDRFLAGDSLYQSRRARAEELVTTDPDRRDEFYETERRKTLAQFFRVSEKAFKLSKPAEKSIGFRIKHWFKKRINTVTGRERQIQREIERSKSGAWSNYQKFLGKDKLSPAEQQEKEHLERLIFTRQPWKLSTTSRYAFLTKVEKAMAQKIEAPKRELVGSIFRRGMESLQKNMPFDILPDNIKRVLLHWQDVEKTLREALQIDQLRTELEAVRQSGDMGRISSKEREIANKIQRVISCFPQRHGANNPSEMVATQHIDCVGASTLGGVMMQEVGLNYLVGCHPTHATLFLVTNDGQVEWLEMLDVLCNEDLTDKMIAGIKKDGLPIKTSDIVAFSQEPKPEGLTFDIIKEKYRGFGLAKETQRQSVVVFGPDYGHQILILHNTGEILLDLGRTQESIETFRQAIALNPKCADSYNGIGNDLRVLDRNKEAIEAYCQAISFNPMCADYYYGLGGALHSLGRNEEAFEAYRKFIELADRQRDDRFIRRAKQIIARTQ